MPGPVLDSRSPGLESGSSPSNARQVPQERRSAACGLFTAIFGLALMSRQRGAGWLYDISLTALVVVALAAQLAGAMPILVAARENP